MFVIEFEYTIEDIVKTRMGDKGIIMMAAIDGGGIQYYVSLKGGNSAWYPERELIKCRQG